MAFWKKSEDPWDVDPEKQRRQPVTYIENEEPKETDGPSVIETLSGLFKKKEVSAEEEIPVPCPYCGKTMKKGYLNGGRDNVHWTEGKPGLLGIFDDRLLISDEGGLLSTSYKTCYMCEACRKLIVDVPEQPVTGFAWDGNLPSQSEQEEEITE